MNNFMNEIFRLYPPYRVAVGNESIALYLNAIGNFLIATSFTLIGWVCIIKAGTSEQSRNRIYLSRMFGIFILTCGLARFVDLISLWYNYAIINGILKIATGLMACVTLVYVPKVLRELKDASTIIKVKETLDKTVERLDHLDQIQQRGIT